VAAALFELAQACQERGWSAEELLRAETDRREKALRREEARRSKRVAAGGPSKTS